MIRKIAKSAARIFGAVFFVYLILLGFIWWKQDALVYFPDREYVSKPSKLKLKSEDVFLKTSDGARIHGWFLPTEDTPRASVLYFHGNGGNVSNTLFFLAELHAHGYETLAIDYHGYADSEGKPTEKNLYLDADAAWEWMTKTHAVPPGHVVIWGHSLGGGVASYLAEKERPRALILESTFTSVPDVGASEYWWMPVHLLATNVYPSIVRVPHITCPILVGHSKQDGLIPYPMGQSLFAAAHEPKRWLELKGGHNDGFDVTPGAWEAVADFLATAN